MGKVESKNPWQRLLQQIAAHMHEEVTDDRVDRALKTAAGGLTRNPPYVVDQFAVETGGVAEAGAISPKGIIAVVLAEYRGREGTATHKHLRLLTRWPDGRRELRDLGGFTARVSVTVVFPQGSDEPAVCLAGVQLNWGGCVFPPHSSNRFHCLTLWCDDDQARHVAFVENDVIRHFVAAANATKYAEESETFRTPGETRWIGLVGGSLASITITEGGNLLRWRDSELPVLGDISPRTVCFVEKGADQVNGPMRDHIQFVAGDRGYYRVYYWSGGTPFEAELPEGNLHVVGNRIFVAAPLHNLDMRLMEFRVGRFQPVGDTSDGMGARFRQYGQLFITRDGFVLTTANENRVEAGNAVLLGAVGGASHDLGIPKDVWVFAPHGRLLSMRESDDRIYGTPFARLTEVEPTEDGREAVMSWAFADGTFHVMRYPLP